MQDENKFSTKYKNYIEIREAWAYCVLTRFPGLKPTELGTFPGGRKEEPSLLGLYGYNT
jgi:hypothetical protein